MSFFFLWILYTWYLVPTFSKQVANGITLKEDDVAVSIVKIDLTNGKGNPL